MVRGTLPEEVVMMAATSVLWGTLVVDGAISGPIAARAAAVTCVRYALAVHHIWTPQPPTRRRPRGQDMQPGLSGEVCAAPLRLHHHPLRRCRLQICAPFPKAARDRASRHAPSACHVGRAVQSGLPASAAVGGLSTRAICRRTGPAARHTRGR